MKYAHWKAKMESHEREVLRWKKKYDSLLAQYQSLIHEIEELRSEPGAGYRNKQHGQQDLVGGNEESR